jgi:cytochrome c
MQRYLLPATLLLIAAVSSAHADDTVVAAGKTAFGACRACHSVEKGKIGIGPSLYGVVGRKAGSLPGFSYSKAMTASGITWDEAALDAFMAAPQAKVPGTRMPFGGLKDPVKRKAIIDYLKALRD